MFKKIISSLAIIGVLVFAGCATSGGSCASQNTINSNSTFQDDNYIWENWTYSPNEVNK